MTVSVREVAELAKVSIGTVSNVLNHPERVAPATAERVQSAIAQLQFVRNDSARQLRAGRSATVGLIVLDGGNPFFSDLARGAEDAALHRGLAVLVGNSDGSIQREQTYLNLFEERQVAGVLITPANDDLSGLKRIRDRGTNVVLVDRGASGHGFSSVSVDDFAGGRLAADHLISIGRRRIFFVGGPFSIPQVADRYAGAARSVSLSNTSMDALPTTSLSVLEGRRVGNNIVNMPASDRPDAIFAANDLVALGLEQAFIAQRAISVPEQIAIVGYDDISYAQSAVVPLTSVQQPARDLGRRAVDLLLSQVNSEHAPLGQLEFTPKLIVRNSTISAPDLRPLTEIH